MASKSAKRTMLLGALCCAAGIIANVLTYSGSASTEEWTYVIAWGAIIFGTIQIIRGAFNSSGNLR